MSARRFSNIASKHLRVFVVEDHPALRDLLTLFLPTLGHWVESAGDAGTALDRLRQGGFDVLLTDLWQPDEHGWCLLEELRARGNLPPYVVSTSAGIQADLVERSHATGCCAHLVQPIRLSEVEQVFGMIEQSKDAPRPSGRCTAADLASASFHSAYRAEALRLRTESRLLCAIVARNIALCGKAVEEVRITLAQWQKKDLS